MLHNLKIDQIDVRSRIIDVIMLIDHLNIRNGMNDVEDPINTGMFYNSK